MHHTATPICREKLVVAIGQEATEAILPTLQLEADNTASTVFTLATKPAIGRQAKMHAQATVSLAKREHIPDDKAAIGLTKAASIRYDLGCQASLINDTGRNDGLKRLPKISGWWHAQKKEVPKTPQHQGFPRDSST